MTQISYTVKDSKKRGSLAKLFQTSVANDPQYFAKETYNDTREKFCFCDLVSMEREQGWSFLIFYPFQRVCQDPACNYR